MQWPTTGTRCRNWGARGCVTGYGRCVTERADPPAHGPELAQLRAWLDFHRDTLRRKCAGLTQAQLSQPLVGELTLGGLMKHLAGVEDTWFSVVLLGNEDADVWQAGDWEADPDWDLHSAKDDTPEELRRTFDEAVAASDRILDEVDGDLDRRAVRERHGETHDLRWIMLHMIEEYARHNGHADLIRESVDGATGE